MNKTGLSIRIWPDKILMTRCRPVAVVDANVRRILDEMVVLMRSIKGIGLAANQVGINLRLATVEATDRIFKIVNPRIIKKQGKTESIEGCLSLPGLELKIKRANHLWVSALDEKGEPLDLELNDRLAIVFQHEIDHLNGVVFIERIPFWQRWHIIPQLKKLKEMKKSETTGSIKGF